MELHHLIIRTHSAVWWPTTNTQTHSTKKLVIYGISLNIINKKKRYRFNFSVLNEYGIDIFNNKYYIPNIEKLLFLIYNVGILGKC